MIRVAVCGVDELLCDAIARRLRRTSVVRCCAEQLHAAELSGFDAMVCVGPTLPDLAVVDMLVRARKHVLLGSETIPKLDELEAIIEHGSATGVRVVVENPDHTLPSRRLIHDELRGSKLGSPGMIRVHRWEAAAAVDPPCFSRLPMPLARDLEMVLWLTDKFPNVMFAAERKCGTGVVLDGTDGSPGNHGTDRTEGTDVGDTAKGTIQVHLGFDDGGMALIDHADCLPEGDGYQSLSTICAQGAMYADDHPNRQLSYRGGLARAEPTNEGLLPLTTLIQRFVDGLSSDDQMRTTLERWRRVRRLAEAVRRSIDSRSSVMMEGI